MMPLGLALTALNVSIHHRPTLFLDSCLDCLSMRPNATPILSCHAVSAFRMHNGHAHSKQDADLALWKGTRIPFARGYMRPAFLKEMPTAEKRLLALGLACSHDRGEPLRRSVRRLVRREADLVLKRIRDGSLVVDKRAAVGILPGLAPRYGPFYDDRMLPRGGWVDGAGHAARGAASGEL